MRNPELEWKTFSLVAKIYDKYFEKMCSKTIEENLMTDDGELEQEIIVEMEETINELKELQKVR